MWISVIFPADDFLSPKTYCEEISYRSSPIVPDEAYNSSLLYRFFEDDFFDEECLLDQGFYRCRRFVFRRSLTRDDFLYILNNMLEFNWT